MLSLGACLLFPLSLSWSSLAPLPAIQGPILPELYPPPCASNFVQGNFVCSPEGLSGSCGRLVSGDLGGDWSPEVATIRGDALVVFHNPDVGNDAVVAAQGALDLCFAAFNGQKPGFWYTSATGLRRVAFDEVDWEYKDAPIDSATLWQGAKLVRASSELLPEAEGFVGVASDGKTVIRALWDGNLLEAPDDLFTMNTTILDVVPFDWNEEDGTKELAILHTNGLHVRAQDGTILMSRGSPQPEAIAALRRPGSADSLAWSARVANQSLLLVFRQELYPGYIGPVAMGAGTVTSMSAGDLEGDGDEDLVLGSSSWSKLRIFENLGAESFVEDGAVDLSLDGVSGATLPSSGRVLVANLFNDWFEDEDPMPSFALLLPESDGLRLMPQLGARDSLALGSSDFDLAAYESACAESTPSEWTVGLGGGWGLTNATHVEGFVRVSPNILTDPEQEPWRHFVVPLSGVGQLALLTFPFDGQEDADPELSNRCYFLEVRPIRVFSGNVTKVWRWSVLGLGSTCEGYGWLASLPGAEGPEIDIDYSLCGDTPDCTPAPPGSTFLGSRYVPSAVPQSRIPGPGPGVLPGGGPPM